MGIALESIYERLVLCHFIFCGANGAGDAVQPPLNSAQLGVDLGNLAVEAVDKPLNARLLLRIGGDEGLLIVDLPLQGWNGRIIERCDLIVLIRKIRPVTVQILLKAGDLVGPGRD